MYAIWSRAAHSIRSPGLAHMRLDGLGVRAVRHARVPIRLRKQTRHIHLPESTQSPSPSNDLIGTSRLLLNSGEISQFFDVYRYGEPRGPSSTVEEPDGPGNDPEGAAGQDNLQADVERDGDRTDNGVLLVGNESWKLFEDGYSAGDHPAKQFFHDVFSTACWDEVSVEDARSPLLQDVQAWSKSSEEISYQLPNSCAYILRRSKVMVSAARQYAKSLVNETLSAAAGQSQDVEKLITGEEQPTGAIDGAERQTTSPDLENVARCLFETFTLLRRDNDRLYTTSADVRRTTTYVLREGIPYRPYLGLRFNDALNEALLTIRCDLQAPMTRKTSRRLPGSDQGPSNKPSHFASTGPRMSPFPFPQPDPQEVEARAEQPKAPFTILVFPGVSGVSCPREAVRDLAAGLMADVVHITSTSLARLLEHPTPKANGDHQGDSNPPTNPISMLRFRVAEYSGRTPRAELTDQESRSREHLSSIIPNWLAGRSAQGTTAEKTNETAEKTNETAKLATLFNMIRNFHEQREEDEKRRPLLIHLHDINALSMDKAIGASFVEALGLFVEDLRSEGHHVALIGTSSNARSSRQYDKALQDLLAAGHRVIVLNTIPTPLVLEALSSMDEHDTVMENAENIAQALWSLQAEHSSNSMPVSPDELSSILAELDSIEGMGKIIQNFSLVERIATTSAGLLHGGRHDLDSLRSAASEAIGLITRREELNIAVASSDSPDQEPSSQRMPTFMVAPQMSQDSEDGASEEQLLSGLIKSEDIRTTFNDIHAPKATIDSIRLLTELSLLRPEEFSYGVLATERIRGCLLYGPPGTGKTLLAKAVAKESGANVLEVSAASIHNRYFGVSEKLIRTLFSLAKKEDLSPLIIFMDEADSLLGSRDIEGDSQGWKRTIVNQFLREMDGLETSSAFVMMATNRPFDLDEALLRRLPRKLLIDLPLEADRAAILRIHLKGEELDGTVSIDGIARRTPLYSGSDLKNLCVAAAMSAVKEEFEAARDAGSGVVKAPGRRRVLSTRHFEDALAQISASVSEDMPSLRAIKKFDDKYGDAGAKRQRRGVIGFGGLSEVTDANVPRVRA
ncbi:Protein MSP1 [Cytospora mali]|uniref:Protein MSP1 n=1 Tax=Cytospora mali TaxID=578113 RepID=A0A194VWA7_CYTMA|nr:Protein MSP1 [Valsa mali]